MGVHASQLHGLATNIRLQRRELKIAILVAPEYKLYTAATQVAYAVKKDYCMISHGGFTL